MARHSADPPEPRRRPSAEAPAPPLGPVTDPLLLAGVEEELRRRRPPSGALQDEGPAAKAPPPSQRSATPPAPERPATPPAPPADFAPRSGRERAEAEQDGPVVPQAADDRTVARTADASDGPDRIGLSVPTMLIWTGVGILAAVALSLAAVLL